MLTTKNDYDIIFTNNLVNLTINISIERTVNMFETHRIQDLTVTLGEDLPCAWPTLMPFKKTNSNWYTRIEDSSGVIKDASGGPFFSEWLVIDEHTGTHFDAPSHFIPHPDSGLMNAGPAGVIYGENVPLSTMIGPAVVINMSHLTGTGAAGESPYVTKQMLLDWEKKNGSIAPCSIVLLYTGWDKFYGHGADGNKYSHDAFAKEGPAWPTADAEAIAYMHEQGVKCFGVDGVSVGACHDGMSSHVAGLSRGMVYIECLANLDKLPIRGSYFVFLPLKLEKSSGGPGRAIAFVPK